jgi:hypothetical protein
VTRRRRQIPFEEWSTGRDGSILFCEQHFRLAIRRTRETGRAQLVPVYKMEFWAAAHEERFGHRMLAVQDAEPLARRLWARGRAAPDLMP